MIEHKRTGRWVVTAAMPAYLADYDLDVCDTWEDARDISRSECEMTIEALDLGQEAEDGMAQVINQLVPDQPFAVSLGGLEHDLSPEYE